MKMRTLWRWSLCMASAGLIVGTLAMAVLVYGFPYPVSNLDPERGGPLLITDRHGNLLRSVPNPEGRPGREGWVRLERIPSAAVLAIVVSEDARFFAHPGVDWQGIARALWLNVTEGRIGYGGSTITMQLMRMIHHPGAPRSIGRKLKEALFALRLERRMDKQAILEEYLNRAYYGHGAYGIDAAARRYFAKPAASLSVGEGALLAILPRAPHRYDLVRNLGAALSRREHVLKLMVRKGLLTQDEVARALAQRVEPGIHLEPFRAPHFVDWVLEGLPKEVRARGGVVRTTLDLEVQNALEHRVKEHVTRFSGRGLEQAGVVVMDAQGGDVLAMVGSTDYSASELNIATWQRHPGSALKPFVYALALEAGATPASIAYDINDVPSAYRVDKDAVVEHGPVRYREALAGSYNLAAVHVLESVGVERLLSTLKAAGLGLSKEPNEYGLRLALGSARVKLVDLAAAYGFLVRGGAVIGPASIEEVTFANGEKIVRARSAEVRLFSPEVSWLTMDMLADSDARHAVFGPGLPLDLPFAVAAKTGTARGFADTVAVAATQELVVAAWAGTVSGRSTQGLKAMNVAAPLVRDGLLLASEGRSLTLPPRPETLTSREVCTLSGKLPGAACPHRKLERFVNVPTQTCDWHRAPGKVTYPEVARAWARRHVSRPEAVRVAE